MQAKIYWTYIQCCPQACVPCLAGSGWTIWDWLKHFQHCCTKGCASISSVRSCQEGQSWHVSTSCLPLFHHILYSGTQLIISQRGAAVPSWMATAAFREIACLWLVNASLDEWGCNPTHRSGHQERTLRTYTPFCQSVKMIHHLSSYPLIIGCACGIHL